VDVGGVVAAVVPYLSALAGAYGSAVVARVTQDGPDAAADATVNLGRRLLRRLVTAPHSGQAIGAAVSELGEHPDDEDLAAVVRVRLKTAMADDPALMAEVAQILAEAGVGGGKFRVAVSSSQGVQVGDHNTQTNTFGPTPR
jgi:hypothetical protein